MTGDVIQVADRWTPGFFTTAAPAHPPTSSFLRPLYRCRRRRHRHTAPCGCPRDECIIFIHIYKYIYDIIEAVPNAAAAAVVSLSERGFLKNVKKTY